jgi:uncharacterized protein YigE (DUF2233 family)
LKHLIFRALLVGLLPATLAHADWQIAQTTRENPPNELVEHRRTEVDNAETGARATVHLAIFKTKEATLRVLDQPESPRRDLAEVMTQEHALAAVNGGYFDPEDAPVGLLVSDGKKITPLSTARLLSGVLLSTTKRVEIVRAHGFKPDKQIRAAVQCGPLLLDNAKPLAGLNNTRPARRTFAAVNGRGTAAALGYCSSVSLAQLGEILSLTNLAGGVKFARALNLDGGSSSAFWCQQGDDPFSISEQKTVRDFVAIVPRPAR